MTNTFPDAGLHRTCWKSCFILCLSFRKCDSASVVLGSGTQTASPRECRDMETRLVSAGEVGEQPAPSTLASLPKKPPQSCSARGRVIFIHVNAEPL